MENWNAVQHEEKTKKWNWICKFLNVHGLNTFAFRRSSLICHFKVVFKIAENELQLSLIGL